VLGKITFMLLKGLYQLHKQMHIVHRDIKPANILLNLDGVAKISDFGISRPLDNTLAMCATWKGTQNYMAPERIERRPYGFASDIWSLGLVVLECATGEYPFNTSEGPVTTMTDVRCSLPSAMPPCKTFCTSSFPTWASIVLVAVGMVDWRAQ
jgi:mitogen-activated protein kinase kinase 3